MEKAAVGAGHPLKQQALVFGIRRRQIKDPAQITEVNEQHSLILCKLTQRVRQRTGNA